MLGLDNHAAEANEAATAKNTAARHIVIGAGGGCGIAFAILEMLHGDPKEWASMLEHWGPWFLIALVGMWFAYDLIKTLGFAFIREFTALVKGVVDSGAALREVAEAQRQAAEKDDSTAEQCRLMSQYAARTADQQSAELKEQRCVLEKILIVVQDLGGAKA